MPTTDSSTSSGESWEAGEADRPDSGRSALARRTEAQLAAITAALPRGEDRPGQRTMAVDVARAIEDDHHLIAQAGTGTGKSLAYLVPLLLSGRKTVVATATKALQDQLAGKDLPFLEDHLDVPFSSAVLKGRSNYLCRQRLHELTEATDQLALDGLDERVDDADIALLETWAAQTATGDRADLDREVPARVWSAVSVGPRECPGRTRCPQGHNCFAEHARDAAAEADVIVVNTHLYGLHLASGGMLLPEHDVVVIDEAHQLEDTISATAGVQLAPSRFASVARNVGAVVADESIVANLNAVGERLRDALADDVGRRIRGSLSADLEDAVSLARTRVEIAMAALRNVPDDGPGAPGPGANGAGDSSVAARKQRAMKSVTSLTDDLDAVLDIPPGSVAWIDGTEEHPVLEIAPIDVSDVLRPMLWERVVAVLTSATMPSTLATSLGIEPGTFDTIDVGTTFDYAENALLYGAASLPDPRTPAFDPATHDELEALITAAGGRTLSLFTSFRAMRDAADALRDRVPFPILTQDDLPKPALVAAFAADPETCLFATIGFWQGIDVPGPTLSLVTIDRIPFPRPDEPLLQARRERARADAFRIVDLPRAATMLAQGAGRLIRTSDDRGVVAIFDPRVATARSYRWDLVSALPPMRRTRERAEAEALLRSLRTRVPEQLARHDESTEPPGDARAQ